MTSRPPLTVEPYRIYVDDVVLSDLQARIRHTRWPDQIPGIGWDQGTELSFIRRLLAYWADGFDWRTQESELNSFDHFRAELDGVRIHFVHARAEGGGIPLILNHGWPSTFVELLPLARLLTNPGAYGIDGPAFDVVIPSLPGYGYSERPARTGVTYRYVAGLWHDLMQGLGYSRYGAQGGDFGAGVATYMALDNPGPMIGTYLTTMELAPPIGGAGGRPITEAERRYQTQLRQWSDVERGYSSIQSTKPQTVGYGLNDSPAGLAAWILEKWRSWTDSGGDVEARLSRDFLLTMLTVYWATQTITTSMRDYFDNRWSGDALRPGDFVQTPTAFAVFTNLYVPEGDPPREWAERLYNVRRWTRMPRGGHFGPVEEPDLVARDIAAFFAEL